MNLETILWRITPSCRPADGHDPGMTNRHTGLRPVHWDAEGLPRLDMTPERELSPGFQIQAVVEITEAPKE